MRQNPNSGPPVDAEWLARQQALLQPLAPALADALPRLFERAPDADMGRANWEQLAEWPAALADFAAAAEPDHAALFRLIGSSQSLTRTLLAAGAGWPALFRWALEAGCKSVDAHVAELEPSVALDADGFAAALRAHRQREYLRIGTGDLCGRFCVETTMAELADLADAAFEASYRWARRFLRTGYGDVYETPRPQGDGFVVLGMGKLGGGELNYSSDVDVLYLYDSDDGETSGGPRGTLTAREFFTRLAELVTRALHEVTAAGLVFRVDLRLRPEGINGPIANSIGSALTYYGSWGQTWERTALIQARPVAGDRRLGEQFIEEIRPFVYRRYLDYSTIADMKLMKSRVETELGVKGQRGHVKLGRGGIREVEFVAQVLQLIHGGRDERLRVRGTLAALSRLVPGGYLPAVEGEKLAAAYRFLRNVEHKIQIVHERQTHAVPAARSEQDALARRLELGDGADLWTGLDRHTIEVRRAFEKLFYEPASETQRAGDPAVLRLLDGLDDHAATLGCLRELGFTEPEARREDLLLLRDGSPSAPASPRRTRALLEVAPALLTAVVRFAHPDQALRLVATFVSKIGARTSFLALLRENPGTMAMLVRLFAGSQFLANVFLRHPEALDTMVRADLARVRVPRDELTAEITRLLDAADDFEEQLDALRRFRNEHFVRIGINDLEGLLDAETVADELTLLAEVCLDAAYRQAARMACERFGLSRLPGALAIIGMGKLGGDELNYNSDLDLIFVYDAAEGALPAAQECFTKLAQQLMTILQVATREGVVYRIDTRLRPSGQAGPLVSSLAAFREYHERSAQVWERQALIKARVVAGDTGLASVVEDIVTRFVYRCTLTEADAQEMHRLRTRMERELAHETLRQVNIKTGRGGLVDVEFVTQMLQLRSGVTTQAVRLRSTLAALGALHDAGIVAAADYETLGGGYRFLRRLEQRMRLAQDRPVDELDRAASDLGTLARQLGYVGTAEDAAASLWADYVARRDAVRACYLRLFDLSEPGG